MSYRYWTNKEVEKLTHMWKCGCTGPEIKAELNRSLQAISHQATKLGMPKRPYFVTDWVWTADKRQIFIERRKNGISKPAIARELGVTLPSLRSAIRRGKLPMMAA